MVDESMANINATSNSPKDITFDAEFIRFYKKLQKRPNVFILFNHNTFYTLHDENADYVSKNFLNSTEYLKKINEQNGQKRNNSDDENDITFTWISQTRFSSLIRHLLIENNFCVEVYSKQNPKAVSNKNWQLELEASPGCLGPFENLLLEEDGTNISIQLSSVFVTQDHMVHVVSIDPISCTIYFCIFKDNDYLRLLESILVHFDPKECLIQNDMKKLEHLMKKNRILSRHYCVEENQIDNEVGQILKDLSLPNCCHIVNKILRESCDKILIPLKPLLQKQKLQVKKMMTDQTDEPAEYPFKCFFIQQLYPEKFVRLDLSSIQHLHLFPKDRNVKAKQSLFQLLNHCKSTSGMKLLEKLIRQPLMDLNKIETRLDIVEYFIKNNHLATVIREQILPQFPDISKLYKKLYSNRVSSLKDIFKLYILLEQLRHLKLSFDEHDDQYPTAIKNEIIDKLTIALTDTNQLYITLAKSLDLDRYRETGQMQLNAKAFTTLVEVDELLKKMDDKIQTEHEKIKSNYNQQVTLQKDEENGWYYQTTKKSKNDFYGSIVCQTISSGDKDFKFLSRLLRDLNYDYLQAEKLFQKLSIECLKVLLKECRQDLHRISTLETFVALLDVLLSFAKVAALSHLPYTKPKILPKGSNQLQLNKFRHPILEINKNGEFVPNDICFDEHCKFFVITGPNMGGKSTLLRSVALNVLMAHIGSFVPCEMAQISLVDAIYTRISSTDDQSMGISTFMAEMTEMAGILKSTTENSLVLIDELGRSTATNDGFGLAQSITEHISTSINAYALFATHFHNLGAHLPNVSRLHMKSSFNEHQLVIHYIAQPESIINNSDSEQQQQSFGIEVMKHLQMPEHLIKQAESRLSKIYNSSIDSGTFNDSMQMIMKQSKYGQNFEENIDDFIQELNELV